MSKWTAIFLSIAIASMAGCTALNSVVFHYAKMKECTNDK